MAKQNMGDSGNVGDRNGTFRPGVDPSPKPIGKGGSDKVQGATKATEPFKVSVAPMPKPIGKGGKNC